MTEDKLKQFKDASELFNANKIQSSINTKAFEIMRKSQEQVNEHEGTVKETMILIMAILSPVLAEIIRDNNDRLFEYITNSLSANAKS